MELPASHPPPAPDPLTGDDPGDGHATERRGQQADPVAGDPGPAGDIADSADDTVDLDLSGDIAALLADPAAYCQSGTAGGSRAGRRSGDLSRLDGPDLLDGVRDWPAASTPCGMFQLVPVRVERDLPLVTAWMNDPAVAEFWELSGPSEATAEHLNAQLHGDGRSVPCLGVLDGVPMSYWEIYRADLDALARYYPARPHDTGVHLLVGGVADRGRGVGTALLRAVGDLILDHRPGCRRVLAEPDLRNVPSVAAFLGAGFRFSAEVDLPGKRAALLIRDR